MHPSSPHAPARLAAAGITSSRSLKLATPKSAAGRTAENPLDALEREIHGKVAYGTSAARAHAAAAELTLLRPRRPHAQRAGFRSPPAS